jgi:hypothetical protein
VRSPKIFYVNLCQKVPFVLACFQASAAPQPENSDSDEKDALLCLNTQITIFLELLKDVLERVEFFSGHLLIISMYITMVISNK